MVKIRQRNWKKFGFTFWRCASSFGACCLMVQPSVAGWKQCFYGCGKTLNKTENDSKSQKKSHSALRAKRATFTFWVDKSALKMPKMENFCEFLKTLNLQSNSATRQVRSFLIWVFIGLSQKYRNPLLTVVTKNVIYETLGWSGNEWWYYLLLIPLQIVLVQFKVQ